MKATYSNEELKIVVENSTSIRQCLIKLNLNATGSAYYSIKTKIKKLNLDTSHFLGQAHNRGKIFGPKRDTQDYLSNKYPIGSSYLRRRLLKEQIFEYKCYKCNATKWLDGPIPLELHHINGNHLDNNLTNLILLCPNCHYYIEHQENKQKKNYKTNICIDCSKPCNKIAIRCKKCSNIKNQSFRCKRPDKYILSDDIKNLKYFTKIGKKYNVSDNAVRKWCRTYNIPIK